MGLQLYPPQPHPPCPGWWWRPSHILGQQGGGAVQQLGGSGEAPQTVLKAPVNCRLMRKGGGACIRDIALTGLCTSGLHPLMNVVFGRNAAGWTSETKTLFPSTLPPPHRSQALGTEQCDECIQLVVHECAQQAVQTQGLPLPPRPHRS